MSVLCDAAIALRLPVFPCGANKAPLVAHGFKAATTDAATIRRQFTDAARLIGMPTGAQSGVWVVDVDVKPGRSGLSWLAENEHALPRTRTHRTRSGGVHLLFRWDATQPVRNSAGRIAHGVDVRGEGGFVIVPPSPGYAVTSDAPIADAPRWLYAAATRPRVTVEPERLVRGTGTMAERVRGRVARSYAAVAGAAEGTRNDTLNRESFILALLAKEGLLDRETVYAEMTHAAYKAGLPAPEVRATLLSALSAAGL